MINIRYFPLLLLLVFTMAFHCNRKANGKDNKESITTTAISDVHGDWVVRSLTLTGAEEIQPKKYYTLNISTESLGLPLDINQCGTSYHASKDSIHIAKGMTCTEACCDGKNGTAIARFLNGSVHYKIKDGVLSLAKKEGTLKLFKLKTNLINSRWTAISYHTVNDDTDYKFSNPYTLVFEPMNAVLKLDANNCFSRVNYSENAFEIAGNMGCSRKCCDSKDGILLRDIMQGKNTYTTKGKGMTVTTKDHIIEFILDESTPED